MTPATSQSSKKFRQQTAGTQPHYLIRIKRVIFALAFFLVLAGPAFAQGALYKDIAWRYTPAGAFPAGGATITVCTSAGAGTPCTPTVTVYSDSGLTLPVTNPLPKCTVSPQFGCLDNLGNFSFYVTPGNYTYTITGAGLTAYGPIPAGTSCVAGVTCLANPSSVLLTANGGITSAGPNTLNGTTTFAGYGRASVTLANGANQNIAAGTSNFIEITGPNGAFSLGGFTGGAEGKVLRVLNGTAQAMTINNLDAGSTAANKILTSTGAAIVLAARTGTFADFIYESADNLWILTSVNLGDQPVGRDTTDTLTNKTLTSPIVTNPSTTGTDSGAETLSNKTLASPTINTPTVTSPTLNTGVSQGSGFKHQRFGATCTTGAGAYAACATTYSWTVAFADTNYTPICVGVSNVNNSAELHISSFTASGVTIQVQSNNSAGAAVSFGGVNCIAVHD
jgi:hypothetical protein